MEHKSFITWRQPIFSSCFYVVADKNGVSIRIVLVRVASQWRSAYLMMLEKIYNGYLKVFYEGSDQEIISTFIELERDFKGDFRHATDGFMMYQRLQLTKAVDSYAREFY